MEQRDGAVYQRRWRIGYDGKEIDVRESRVDYVMGSGNHARTLPASHRARGVDGVAARVVSGKWRRVGDGSGT